MIGDTNLEYKKLRQKALSALDEGLQEKVATPAEKAGVGTFGAGVAAGVSALADFIIPEDWGDVAAMAAGGPLLKAASKIGKMKKLKKLAKPTQKVEKEYPDLIPDEEYETVRKQLFDEKKGKWTDAE